MREKVIYLVIFIGISLSGHHFLRFKFLISFITHSSVTNLKEKDISLIACVFSLPCKTGSSIFEKIVLLIVLSSIFRFLKTLLKNLLKVSARYAPSIIIVYFRVNKIDSFERDFSENTFTFSQNCLLSFIMSVSRFAK